MNGTEHEMYENFYAYDNEHNLDLAEYIGENGDYYWKHYVYSNHMPVREYIEQNNTIISEKYVTYDECTHQIETITDGEGNTEIYKYGIFGLLYEQEHADQSSVSTEYSLSDVTTVDENGHQLTKKYKNGAINYILESDSDYLMTATIDDYGRVTSVTDAEHNSTSIEYDPFDRQRRVTYPIINGQTSESQTFYFDVFLEGTNKYTLVMKKDPEGHVSCNYYDIKGRLVKTAILTDYGDLFENNNTAQIYSLPSNVQMIVTGTMEYNELDQMIRMTDGDGRVTEYTYDIAGNVLSVRRGSGEESLYTEYTYDVFGNVLTMSQGEISPHVTTYEYDPVGRLNKVTDPMGYTEQYAYDKAGNVVSFKDKNGDITISTYDNRNRLSTKTKGGKTVSYTYDYVGNILSSTDENGTITYEYNNDDTLKKKTMPDGKLITYNTYDGNKKLTKMTDYFGNETSYTYDSHGNVASVGEKYSGSTAVKTTAYTYNADDTLSFVSIPNNMTVSYTYDSVGRLIQLNNNSPYMYSHSTHLYEYDNSGNIIRSTETMFDHPTLVSTYMYDGANRLRGETGKATWWYTYDEYNNIVSTIGDGDTYFTYDENNRLIKVDDLWCAFNTAAGYQMDDWEADYTYDNNGKLLSMSRNSAPGCEGYTSNQVSYTYDTWGRLTGYSDSLGKTASYGYYSDGLRSQKTVDNTTIKYYYNGSDVINETKNGTNFATNVMGVDGPISRQYSGYEHYFYKNIHGDVIFAFTSNHWRSSEYSYDAYGNGKVSYDYFSANPNPVRYSGQYYDTESGMTYLRARYYDPYQRRFISEDPAKDGVNWYAYCGNNPVMFVDPLGLYDRKKAVDFATFYYNYDMWEYLGHTILNNGDCTHFVSVCLQYGELHQSDDWYMNFAFEIAGHMEGSYSRTWVLAEEQYWIFSNNDEYSAGTVQI